MQTIIFEINSKLSKISKTISFINEQKRGILNLVPKSILKLLKFS